MSTFFYKYTTAKSFTKGKKAALYFSRFFFQLYRSLPILLRLAMTSFRFFTLFSKSYNPLTLRLLLLAVHQFLQMYQVIFLLRILTEYYFVNQHNSNKFIKTIFILSEPYFKIVQMFMPKGLVGAIIGFQAIEVITYFIKRLCTIFIYANVSSKLNALDLLLLAWDEKILFID